MSTQPSTLDPFYWFVFTFVIAGWFAFGVAFLFRKRPRRSAPRVWRNQSIWGIVLMGIGMALVWWIRRPVGLAFVAQSRVATYFADALACVLTLGSIWLILAAVYLLGKQWNVRAIVVEQHQLITTGPYAYVRHPIYTGMIGLMLSTGIANSYWHVLLGASVFALAGMVMRVRDEEQLLLETFGSEYETYRNRVPAFFPWFRRQVRAA